MNNEPRAFILDRVKRIEQLKEQQEHHANWFIALEKEIQSNYEIIRLERRHGKVIDSLLNGVWR